MSSTIYLKDKSDAGITAVDYSALADKLKQYPNGFVGVETPSGGNMQHYFYEMIANPKEIRRYPMRKIGDTYSCMRMYTPLLENSEDKEKCFGTPTPLELPPPSVLNSSGVYFTASDMTSIDAIKETSRSEKLKTVEITPYFPDLELTQLQQQFLYENYVLRSSEPFQETLRDILNHKTLSVDEKETILRACISKERIPISGDPEVLMRNLQTSFLTIGAIINYPVDALSTDVMTQGKKALPTLGAIQAFYVRCIQSHLQRPVEKKSLNLFAPLTAIISLGTIAPTQQIEPFNGLTEKEETCFNALNVLLMSSGHAQGNLKNIIETNPKFMDVFDELLAMLSDLKGAVDKKTPPSKPEFEMIYREFFTAHEISMDSLSQLASLNPAYLALKALQPLAHFRKFEKYETASAEEREVILDQLRAIQKDLTNPALSSKVTWFLFSRHLMSPAEKGSLFLEYVAKGNQDFAERMLKQEPDLLRVQGEVTDYSTRTFNCTAYEYAYWAKDTHMCRMLERYMSDETNADIALRIEAIESRDAATSEPVGLTYRQHGGEHHSAHFNLSALKTALNEYVQGYDNWERTSNWTAMEAAWMKIGLAQRDVPVHVINEYCRRDVSFDPCPEFNEDMLPRKLMFYNFELDREEPLFPLVISASSELGIDFALVRSWDRSAIGVPGRVRMRGWVTAIDLAAVSRLDEVRTIDLKLSREILGLVDPEAVHGSRP